MATRPPTPFGRAVPRGAQHEPKVARHDCSQSNAAQGANEQPTEKEVRDAKKTLHTALTLCLNKVLCPLILKTCWNFVVKDRPLSYTESAAICLGAATLRSFTVFSCDM